MTEPKFLTPREVVQRSAGAVTERTLANWRSTGSHRLPYHKWGGRVRYAVEDVEKFESEQRYENGKRGKK
jgi:hypothetical protein